MYTIGGRRFGTQGHQASQDGALGLPSIALLVYVSGQTAKRPGAIVPPGLEWYHARNGK